MSAPNTTSAGIFFFVVGPSGAGKDSLIEGARRLEPNFCFARRAITRPAGSPGEDHDALDDATFDALDARGEFLVTWSAHGLRYGLRRDLLDAIAQGRHVIANGSRRMIGDLAARVPRLVVIEVGAPAEVLEARLLGRGRETAEQVRARVAREVEPCTADVEIRRIVNDGSLEEGIERFMHALRHAIEPPSSTPLLQAKLAGASLDETQYEALFDDILALRYAERNVDRFLLHACQHVSDAEVLALARVRAKRMPRIEWNEPIVVDKHSMGGIPGSRITLIVVPIVAAYGLAMPKTSSRAITSAAGTADAMETVARVDLTSGEVRHCVETARACIAWNGKLNHSLIDDRINAFTRPLGLDTNRWSVASILSKKVSAGSTHVMVDLPCGPRAKLKDADEAHALAALFEYVGAGVGLQVKALVTDGSGPVGRGIGPALEVRDIDLVLDDAADAPPDLRDKALTFASHILAWAPGVRDVDEGRRIAQTLLASGAARAAFERIVDAQGRHAQPVRPAARVHDVKAAQGGVVASIDGWQVAGIARQAGAPADAGAGVDLLCRVGQSVAPGDTLYRVHATHAAALDRAATLATLDTGYLIV
ncbi:phosphonate metabolism protein/1,5-bisphosphokinase (PRPP-forming) PhnN [Paraburkholderia flava]|uniref:phosphonate metabolism protein/1,5-bisphosphokinase (PRPP-forming) PhnN n=1 Tax=Paraburkholderia flava TaxID=2547393 RepID=UPI00105B3626|nr:phosphonate metabolism protein/1,5-bisphosphokinase (PRPP-forming) PhnN [Paraburkholderia flava]